MKELSDFKTIEIDENQNLDESIYKNLSKLLRKMGRNSQKTLNSIEFIKTDTEKTLSKYKEIIDSVRKKQKQQELYQENLELALLDYFNIINDFISIAEKTNNKKIKDAIQQVIELKKQINKRVGIQEVPGVGSEINHTIHYVVSAKKTCDKKLDNTVKEVLDKGYRIGDNLLRKATVIGYKYKEKNNG